MYFCFKFDIYYFILLDPAVAKDLPKDYLERVKTMHETGGSGSIGFVTFFSFSSILNSHSFILVGDTIGVRKKQEKIF